MSTLRKYIRHAELYGVTDLYESAQRDLDVSDLGRLALHLRRVEPKWRLSQEQSMALAVGLVGDGCADAEVRRMAGVSQPTVRKAHSAAAQTEKSEGVDPVTPGGPV